MPGPRKSQKLEVSDKCTGQCSLNQRNLAIAQLVHSWFEQGNNNVTIIEKAKGLGHPLSNGALGRHYSKHLITVAELDSYDPTAPTNEKVELVPILEQIIGKGAASLRYGTFKVGPETTMKAIELYLKITQGNAQQTWLDAMQAAIDGIEDPAEKSAEEAMQGDGAPQ